MQQRLWGGDQTTVDFDHSLGTAMNKLREALGDSADNPRFIETMARRGYRFIAPIRIDTEAATPKPFLATPLVVQTQISAHEGFAVSCAQTELAAHRDGCRRLPSDRAGRGRAFPIGRAWESQSFRHHFAFRKSHIREEFFRASRCRKIWGQWRRMAPAFIFCRLKTAAKS